MKKFFFLQTILSLFFYLSPAQNCNNWLQLKQPYDAVTAGDLDVTGNQITVEISFNAIEDRGIRCLVSKHRDPNDCNYLLFTTVAQITTSTGFYSTGSPCTFFENKTYHVAFVYNGASLKYYRDGFLMSQVPATGDLVTNDWPLTIGEYATAVASGISYSLPGFINEVRIWNVARTQAQLKTYMNASLPNPTAQTGLLAYYTFNNLLNKQGNAAFDATLIGSGNINVTNTSCAFVADSCSTVLDNTGIGNVINSYTPVKTLNPCDNKITVEDASAFNAGDTVLMIQMKGAVIDSTNSAAFGTILNYKNAGNYEFNYVKSKTGNIIELKNSLTRQYDVPIGKVQLIRVPYYNTANITSTLTCLPWDGNKGGVLVLNAKDSIVLHADVNLSGRGFRGGASPNSHALTLICGENNYSYPAGSIAAASKGEGIAITGDGIAWGKGASANGGGSGIGHNSGGGGGSNGGNGGFGGYQLQDCGNAPFDNRGIGGNSLVYNNIQNKIFMGGGGGSGHTDNAGGIDMNGGNGGGIALINSNYIQANNFNIISKGGDAQQCDAGVNNCHDGGGAGGAGGTILINNNIYLSSMQLNVAGGKGADLVIFDSAAGAGRLGPGGGGGAGTTWFNSTSLPSNVTTILTGGINGVIAADNSNPWGATAGKTGVNVFNLKIPVDNIPFKQNIDSVVIKDSLISCSRFNFKGIAYTTTSLITQWQWDFGDGVEASIQNPVHAFSSAGTFTTKLTATDRNGCKDNAFISVTAASGAGSDFSYSQDICNPLSLQFFTIGIAPLNPHWLFGDGASVTGNINPVHVFTAPGTYAVKYSSQSGACIDTVTKIIPVNIINDDLILTRDTTICPKSTKQLLTKPALNFCWSPTQYLDDPRSANPTTSTPKAITYFFTAEVPGDNVITNGDFNSGNTGFTSQYSFVSVNTTEGEYFVGPNAQAWNTSMSSCPDHTTGTGNMLLVNGAPVGDVVVWTQTVAVTPNTNYAFSTWIEALYPPNPAQLSFSINGGTLGDLITASLPTCTWNQFYTTWNSGSNTSATISIVNKNTYVQGNDFALDDISFSTVVIKRDSIKINIDTATVRTNPDTAACPGARVQLNTSGGVSYSWLPASGLSNAAIPNPIATPATTTQYIVTGINGQGCAASDTVNITVKPSPSITKSADSTICAQSSIRLFATGGISYSWSPAATLNNPSTATPVAAPTGSTTYVVTVTAANGCSKADSVKISVKPLAVFAISPNKSTCAGEVTLSASGGDAYFWSPAALVDDPTSKNPVTNISATTTFTVKIKDNFCSDSAILSTKVTLLPPLTITASKLNDIDCVLSSAQLNATGADEYVWSPATGLNSSNIANPVASVTAQQQYFVTGTDTATRCTGKATVSVYVKAIANPEFYVPNAFSPNGDGRNDCFRVSNFGTVKSIDLSVYNRFGNRVFHTLNVNDCWDGTYKGQPVTAGNYVYFIKAFNDCGQMTKKGNIILIR